jgi:hypothetical protein
VQNRGRHGHAELGVKVKIGCHTFRATGITAYLEVTCSSARHAVDGEAMPPTEHLGRLEQAFGAK